MKTINTLKNAINPNNLGYSEGHTNLFDDGKAYEFFKLESDGYVYVLCIDTNRATRYNGEGQNGKRISMNAYLEAHEALEREAAFKELGSDVKTEYHVYTYRTFYQGMTGYVVEEDGKEVYCGFSATEIIDQFGFDPSDYDEGEEIAIVSSTRKAEEPKTKQPKAKKARKPKDIAFKTVITLADDRIADVTLTAKQTDFIRHLSDTCFWENGLDSTIWVDCLCDDIQGQFAGKPMTVGAMISTLCEKGLGTRATCRREKRKCTSFELTELGKLVAAEVGLQ